MHDYDVIIIGAGIGGLTCGALLAKHGMNVLICEQHDRPGGYCTSYKRGGYRFDVPYAFSGMRKGEPVERIFQYLSVCDAASFVELPVSYTWVYPDATIRCFTDPLRFREELQQKMPSSRREIAAYLDAQNDLWNSYLGMNSRWAQTGGAGGVQVAAMGMLGMAFFDFVRTFVTDERHVEILCSLWGHVGMSSRRALALALVGVHMSFLTGGAWIPRGGYRSLADAVASRFMAEGGAMRMRARVEQVLVDDGSAVGVVLESGEVFRSGYVISNADTRRTFLSLIGPRYLGRDTVEQIGQLRPTFSGLVVQLVTDVSIPDDVAPGETLYYPASGASDTLARLAEHGDIEADPLTMGFCLIRRQVPQNTVPTGHSILELRLPASCRYKNSWGTGDRAAYEDLKNREADRLVAAAEKVIPGLASHIVYRDVNTPLTYERYTGATDGCWYDMARTLDQYAYLRALERGPIDGFYLAGAKGAFGTGIYGAICSGFDTADAILGRNLSREGVLWK